MATGHSWVSNTTTAWEPVKIDGVPGAKCAQRIRNDGESWTHFAWLPGVDLATAEDIVDNDLNWGEEAGRPGGPFHRRPSLKKLKGGVFVRFSGGMDV